MTKQSAGQKCRRLREKLEEALQAGEHPMPIGELLGFHLTELEPGRAVIQMEARQDHRNPMGTLHGGVLCTIADSAMGIAHISLLEEGESFTTLELKINFLRPVWEGRLRAVAKVVKHGRTITLTECEVVDERDNLVAWASSTSMTLRGSEALGR